MRCDYCYARNCSDNIKACRARDYITPPVSANLLTDSLLSIVVGIFTLNDLSLKSFKISFRIFDEIYIFIHVSKELVLS